MTPGVCGMKSADQIRFDEPLTDAITGTARFPIDAGYAEV